MSTNVFENLLRKPAMKNEAPGESKSDVYGSRTNWPPYTYRDYPCIAPKTYKAFMDFLATENTSNRLMELQPWISICDSRCAFCYFPTLPRRKRE